MKTDIQKRLDEDIPKDAIDTRSQGGITLSYLSGAYVINRLNQVFGQGKWSYALDTLFKVYEGTLQNSRGEEVYNTSYTAKVSLMVDLDGHHVEFVDIGYGDGQDKKNPGKAHELAVKEAVTDGLKRAAKNLGISMGLGLYFKDGDYEVDDASGVTGGDAKPIGTPGTGAVLSTKSNGGGKTNGHAGKGTKTGSVDKRTVLREITRTLIALRKTTSDEVVKKYLGGKTAQELTEEDIASALLNINNDYKELNLLKE